MTEHTNELYVPETAAEVVVKDYLREQWDTFYTGDGNFDAAWIHLGWYDVNEEHPQITVTPTGEVPRGERGYSAIDPSGAGPTGFVDGELVVNVWMHHEPYPYDSLGENPRKMVDQLRRTCERIVGQLYNGTVDGDGNPEYASIAPGPWETRPTRDSGPVDYRHELRVFYTYHRARVTVDDGGGGGGDGE